MKFVRARLNKFLCYLHMRGFSQGIAEAYWLNIYRKGMIAFLPQRGKFEVEEVTRAAIQFYLDYVAISRSNCNITRARKLAAIKSFFNYLVENEGLEASPAASIRSPRIPEKEPEYLTEEEYARLLETIALKGKPRVRERDMAMAILFLNDGLRVSELVKLKLVDIDLGRSQIKITRKGNKEQYLHLNGETAGTLINYLANRPQAQNGRFFIETNGNKSQP